MWTIRRAAERGHADHGWLNSWHTFSFADYHDPQHMGFRGLRVINEDRVAPGAGFPTHGHRNMEIISYVLDGALEHKDSLGTGSIIRPGDVQRMSAGTGVQHSEFNASTTEPVHFLQIWIIPTAPGMAPGYEQKTFDTAQKRQRLCLVASPNGADGSVTVHADVRLYAARLEAGEQVDYRIAADRHAWIQVARGEVRIVTSAAAGTATAAPLELEAGDAASTSDAGDITLLGIEGAELLVFDLA